MAGVKMMPREVLKVTAFRRDPRQALVEPRALAEAPRGSARSAHPWPLRGGGAGRRGMGTAEARQRPNLVSVSRPSQGRTRLPLAPKALPDQARAAHRRPA